MSFLNNNTIVEPHRHTDTADSSYPFLSRNEQKSSRHKRKVRIWKHGIEKKIMERNNIWNRINIELVSLLRCMPALVLRIEKHCQTPHDSPRRSAAPRSPSSALVDPSQWRRRLRFAVLLVCSWSSSSPCQSLVSTTYSHLMFWSMDVLLPCTAAAADQMSSLLRVCLVMYI